jgi:hypothetical protein
MNDLHESYMADGEIVYAAKTDSVNVYGGNKRALLDIRITSQRIETVRIYWNSYGDSTDVAINSRVGSFPVILENMEETDYVFYLVSFDRFGNKSLPFEVSGTVYGDKYLSGLSDRVISTASIFDGILTVEWKEAPDNSLYSELLYKDSDGKEHLLQISVDETSRTVDDYASDLKYRTLYKPVPTAIDTFYTEWKPVTDILDRPVVLFDKSSWSVISWSDQAWEARASTLIDGNDDTFWHSDWETPADLPHWAIIDMGIPREITEISTSRRKGMPDTKSVWYYIGNDPDPNSASWTKIAEGTYASGDLLTVQTSVSVAGRYLKIYLPDSNRSPYTSVAEVNVYGLKSRMSLFDKSSWSVISWSSEAWEARASTLIDGSDDTFWHSDWETPRLLPHWAIIDMGFPKEIAEINTYRRKGMPDTKSVWYYVGNDPDPEAASWTKIAEGTFASGDLLTVQTSVSVAGRYLKIYLPDSNREPYISVAEVDAYGYE